MMLSTRLIALTVVWTLAVTVVHVSAQRRRAQPRTQTRTQQRQSAAQTSSAGGKFPLAYVMADGVDEVVGQYQQSFTCEGRDYGYYADLANECKIYHICVPPNQQYTFFCNNGTIFDQKVFTCVREEDSVPCGSQEKYYALNQNFGVQDMNSLLVLE